jgi:hypothetical protein
LLISFAVILLLLAAVFFAVILRLEASKSQNFCGLARNRRCILLALSLVSANAATHSPQP